MAQAEPDGLVEKRPLSPHLSVYKPMLTMMMSMAHRITGASLYLCALLLSLYLLGLAFGQGAYGLVSWIANGLLGHIVVFLFSWALLHHLLGGVRHAIWDRGLMMDPKGREMLAQASLFGGIGLTVLLWIVSSLVG
jgi:succinate dehydrogenase / fumarate reductase cytochrome b subunit